MDVYGLGAAGLKECLYHNTGKTPAPVLFPR
jgi:hypothetical protein